MSEDKNLCIDCGCPLTFYPAIHCYFCEGCGNCGMGDAK